ncbi:5'-nucleotidase C-terminal domain-containing protein [Acholeplasma vituli]|uniref:5'-nucleotidase C-terminal domain-containing protein n=1 Tax=Paracholeplasma vituli TaxID=69473 RepID=A0ABT2PXD8_9MOLU|nr:5'-nucleotidase C-terminal domain-containing protein [Paracholeplasma vituli]MCU0105626.1 5'-nucleotidase C-terminal domain-containing protein [Paracholeplasma vituli]
MKKLLTIVSLVLLSLGLWGCVEDTFDVNAFLKEAVSQIVIPETTIENVELPNTLSYKDKLIKLSWTTDEPEVIKLSGEVIRPSFETGDVEVTLTVFLDLEGKSISKSFKVLVTKLPEPDYITITFNSLGGSLVQPIQVKINTIVSAPVAPTRPGYTFVSWHKETTASEAFNFNNPVTESMTLYATWSKVTTPVDYLDIFYLNDLHGSIEPQNDDLGLAYIANYINFHRNSNPNGVILLAGGDMFQGSALSNYYMGLSTLNIMNAMNFDAMALGNHEFDWGIDQVTNYFDGNYGNGEATFPLLAANAFYSNTTTIIEHMEPYTIIERGDVKIGIIGTIGEGLESSIAQSRINGYYFASPANYIGQYAEHLRTVEKVDYVLAIAHDSGEDLNSAVARFTGNKKVDILFNAHTHRRYIETNNGMQIIQSGSNGKFIGKIRIDLSNGQTTLSNVNDHSTLTTEDPGIQSIIDKYKTETDVLFNTPIIKTARSISSTTLSDWLADLMRKTTNADIAFHNYGGTRDGLLANEDITLGKLYKIFPFDNTIKTVYLDGAQVRSFMRVGGNTYSSTITNFETGKLYKVATNDYLFDKTEYPFVNGVNPEFDGTLLRDMVVEELTRQSQVYSTFDTTNAILVPLTFLYNRSFLSLHI